ncbi:MAG: LamG domain-containing protein [Deltaproteobacteria bacterium]|nr:LamG domain-containing protein [Deltaproteobacteria bacterium]
MPNNFASDVNCKALWRFENGALTADSKGGNTLTAAGTPTADQVNFKEGAASVQVQDGAAPDSFSITDALLDAGFPFKLADAIKKISATFWIKCTAMPADTKTGSVFLKSSAIAHYSIAIAVETDGLGDTYIEFWLGNGLAWTIYQHASALAINTWYHVGVTYQDSDQAYRIRIWDDTAGAILGVDKTGNGLNAWIGDGDLSITSAGAMTSLTALVDEIVVFNDILTVAEIDAIRAGTYGGGKPPIFGGLNRKRCPLNAAQKSGMLAEL